MKYAFIALIACYLLVYGCGPDNAKNADDKKGRETQIAADTSLPAAQLAETSKPEETGSQPSAVTAEAPSQAGQQSIPPAPEMAAGAAQLPEPGREQRPGDPMAEQQDINQATPGIEGDIAVMPCGLVVLRNRMPTDASSGYPHHPCRMTKGPDGEDLIVLPCGRIVARQSDPTLDPFAEQPGMEAPDEVQAQPEIIEEEQNDLASAVQKMVEATNDMVLVTRQLVLATQEMLNATQSAGSESVAPGGDAMQGTQPFPGARQELSAGKQAGTVEQVAAEALKNAAIATQNAVEAANQAVSKAQEVKQ